MPVSAENTKTEITTDTASEFLYTELKSYTEYYKNYAEQYQDSAQDHQEVIMQGSSYTDFSYDRTEKATVSVGSFGSDYQQENRDHVLIWDAPDGVVSYQIEIPVTGIYCMFVSYLPIPANMTSIEFSISIDGEVPYDTASRVSLHKVYQNSREIITDEKGNQIRPSQEQTGIWTETPLLDPDGLFNDPLIFYLEQGSHQISFTINKGYFALDYFKFYQPEKIQDYEDYKNQILNQDTEIVNLTDTPSSCIRIEGEQAVYKSDAVLYPTTDNSSYLTSPSSPSKTVYNTIGAGCWNQAMQSITWEIPEDQIQTGWYKLGIKFRQNEMRGLYSNRRIYIDNQVLCQELDQVKFDYSTNWQLTSPKDQNGEEIYIYLTGGQPHSITMQVIPGEIGESMQILNAVVQDLNFYYRKILMITSATPDRYTDYDVHERIPELLDQFAELSENLKQIQNQVEQLAGSSGSEAAALERMYLVLDRCIKKPLRIPEYLSQIKDNLTALSAWMYDYRKQPLEIDYLELVSPDREFTSIQSNFIKSLKFSWEKFYLSFFEDYTVLTDLPEESEQEVINVWVNSGREQAIIIKSLTESEFMQEYDIPVAINLVVGGVLEATLAGKGPDVTLFLGGEFPVNLAARGLLVDLSQFPDYNQIIERFQENADVPYQYDNGCYGLPLAQSWAMLFYRKDILSELGYTAPPATWDDLTNMLPDLQRNHMHAGLVLPVVSGTNATISAATESGHTFAALMLQNGLNYYTEDQTKTNFDEIRAVKAFETWTDFYTKYGFEQSYDSFSRFRTGEYPLLISDYSFYNQLETASPEIKNLWDFTLIPGTVQEDGSISHAVNSNSSGAVIFNKCKNIEGAWEFLKWFSSAEIQTEYGTQVEGLLGQMGRYPTANTEALTQLAWSKSELQTLLTAQDELQEIPIIPASYAVTRNLMNAFRETVNQRENPRDTLLWYNRDINAEITRKRENLGLSIPDSS